jgi:hypothetical protein
VDPFVVNGPFAGCLTQQTSTKKGAPSKKNEETPKRKVDGTSKKEENKTKQPSNSDQNPSNLHDICSLFALFMADAEKNPAQADSMAVHKMCVFNAKLTGTVFSVDELIPYQKVATILREHVHVIGNKWKCPLLDRDFQDKHYRNEWVVQKVGLVADWEHKTPPDMGEVQIWFGKKKKSELQHYTTFVSQRKEPTSKQWTGSDQHPHVPLKSATGMLHA